MPIYEYECTNCGATLEALQKFSDDPLETCDKCSGKLRKLISHSAFHLKGSGWYVTDYAGGKDASSGTGEAASNADAKTKTETKTETKKDSTE
ncbi:MAG: FmdB family zinc ribbon protein [Desulfatibacillaceae bacterium]